MSLSFAIEFLFEKPIFFYKESVTYIVHTHIHMLTDTGSFETLG